MTKVLIERGFTLWISLNAFLIWTLLANLCTLKVKVFLSVINLLAFSVLSGWTRTENLSNLPGSLRAEVDLAYFGLEATWRVDGLKNRRLVLTLYFLLMVVFLVAAEVCLALLSCWVFDAI